MLTRRLKRLTGVSIAAVLLGGSAVVAIRYQRPTHVVLRVIGVDDQGQLIIEQVRRRDPEAQVLWEGLVRDGDTVRATLKKQ